MWMKKLVYIDWPIETCYTQDYVAIIAWQRYIYFKELELQESENQPKKTNVDNKVTETKQIWCTLVWRWKGSKPLRNIWEYLHLHLQVKAQWRQIKTTKGQLRTATREDSNKIATVPFRPCPHWCNFIWNHILVYPFLTSMDTNVIQTRGVYLRICVFWYLVV